MKLCGTKSGQDLNSGRLKIVIIKMCVSNHKPYHDQAVRGNLTTLWETVIVSNENVQEPTKMAREIFSACGRHNNGNG